MSSETPSTSSDMQKLLNCAACALVIDTVEQLKCGICALRFHFECGISTSKKFEEISPAYRSTWVCPTCHSKQPRGDNSNTPIRGNCTVASDGDSTANVTMRRKNNSAVTQGPLTLENVKELMQKSSDDLLNRMERKFTKIMDVKTKEIFKEVNEIKDSISYLNAQYEGMKEELRLKCDQMKNLKEENEALKTTVKDINNRLSVMEQHSRISNIEIQCIPEHKTENLVNVVAQIARITGSKLEERDIHKCTRIAKINPENKRPRSVVIKFSSPRVRDSFMAGVIQFNKKNRNDKLNTSHIGIVGEKKPVYVVDHLTPVMKKIHAAAREVARKLQYKFVWIKNGRVFMRKSETSEHIIIRDLCQLDLLT
ncbi:Zinc finger DNA binding protein [Operophtera brumata]|uniref:Zinc finger DNA binding protein n=1 Tax=Operophtera brumata TaxID=104452 RepID=A0A0L7KQ92_OPEBR|nr:Zinc finger DNA binding protein [Operophtera brumata]